MKSFFILIILILCFFLYSIFNQNETNKPASKLDEELQADWQNDLLFVKAKAIEEKKPILMYFTGSNWCSACIRLNKEIFSKPFFIDYANEHLVLMKVDFPLGVQQKESLINQNNQLYDDYEIASLPTVIVLDSDGEIYREAGYGRGTPKDYVAFLKSLFPEKM